MRICKPTFKISLTILLVGYALIPALSYCGQNRVTQVVIKQKAEVDNSTSRVAREASQMATDEQEFPDISLVYDLMVEGEKIGRIESTRKKIGKGETLVTQIKNKVKIRDTTFLVKYSVDSEETLEIGPKGLIRYSGQTIEDGKYKSIVASIKENGLALQINNEGRKHSEFVARIEYDTTSEEVIGYFLKTKQKKFAMKMLDLDTFEVAEIVYEYLGEEKLHIAGHPLYCLLVYFKTPYSAGFQWVTEDLTGVWVVKETGTNDGNEYAVTIKRGASPKKNIVRMNGKVN